MSDEEKYYEAMREAADWEERTEIEQGHVPHIVPTRRDVMMSVNDPGVFGPEDRGAAFCNMTSALERKRLEQEIERLRAELSSNTGRLDDCRRLLREACEQTYIDDYENECVHVTSRVWLEAARAAGGECDDE